MVLFNCVNIVMSSSLIPYYEKRYISVVKNSVDYLVLMFFYCSMVPR